MKGVLIYGGGGSYCKYPDNINSIEEFAEYINKNYNSFIKLTVLSDDDSFPPYFIEGCESECYISVSKIHSFEEYEYTILSKSEYDERLKKVVNEKCKTCSNWIDDCEDDLEDCRRNISLDGECFMYNKIKED